MKKIAITATAMAIAALSTAAMANPDAIDAGKARGEYASGMGGGMSDHATDGKAGEMSGGKNTSGGRPE